MKSNQIFILSLPKSAVMVSEWGIYIILRYRSTCSISRPQTDNISKYTT